jgi:ribosomal protein S18 acetylase RimI-like enzyme
MAVEEIIIRRAADLTSHIDGMVDVYDRAFREPPYNHNAIAADGFRGVLPTHLTYPDFEAILLYEAGRLIGFVYGHTNRPGQWWYRQIAPSLPASIRETVFDDAWVIVELAVDPDGRRRGLGRRLLETTMAGKLNRWAVLTTMDANSAAVQLYDQAGFQPLLRQFVFPEGLGRWLVLARELGSGMAGARDDQRRDQVGEERSPSESSR